MDNINMSYIIYLKDHSSLEYNYETVWNGILSLEKTDICSVHKLYHYKKPMNICIYDYGHPYLDYLGNYKQSESFYGANAIDLIDEKIINYLQNKETNNSDAPQELNWFTTFISNLQGYKLF